MLISPHRGLTLYNKGTLKKLLTDVATDTIVLFDLGDLAVACASAEALGIGVNIASTGIAIGNRIYSSLTGKPKELGFYAAAVVSAGTAASIGYNAVHQLGWDNVSVFNGVARNQFIWPFAAFAFWTFANALGGWNKSRNRQDKGILDNEQTYFSLGSAAVAKGNPFAVTCFMAALAKTMIPEQRDDAEPHSWTAFFNKHVTPKRLRAVGYGIGAATTVTAALATGSWWFVAAYALLTAGNFFYDKGKNKTLVSDMETVKDYKRREMYLTEGQPFGMIYSNDMRYLADNFQPNSPVFSPVLG